jgi:hypothetical protein
MSEPTAPLPETAPAPPARSSWSYVPAAGDRDLRIDFLRGMVMLVLVTVHIELFSLYNLVTWERFGVVSGGEGFVLLSGFVIGMVYRRRIEQKGWRDAGWKLLDRAAQLYRVNLFVIVGVFLLSLLPLFDMSAVMTFNDRYAGQVYPLYPEAGTNVQTWLARLLTLKIGPHQIQILGLYVFLLLLSPAALFLLREGRWRLLLALSWILYVYNWAYPALPTGAQFEYAFPLLTWQLLFFHGTAAGYHRENVFDFMAGRRGRPVLLLAFVLFFAFLFFAQNTPNPVIPAWSRIAVIPADVYGDLYGKYFLKNTLGILRILNYAAALAVALTLLTRLWKPAERAFGWFFIPIGQASLYVFIVHVFVVALVSMVLPFHLTPEHGDLWINTLGHTVALAILWLMVRYRVFYRWIPR